MSCAPFRRALYSLLLLAGVSGIIPPAGPPGGHTRTFSSEVTMSWKKPEFEVVAVTMEVTAYVATL